jgi:hypothetical protein
MLVCQWHLDIVFGKQSDALRVMRAWGKDKFEHSEFRRAKGGRVMVGHIGDSPSHVVDEYYFESLADWEEAMKGMGGERFKQHADALAPYVVAGSQRWVVYRVVE